MADAKARRISDKGILSIMTTAHLFDDLYMNLLPPLIPVLVSSFKLSFAAAGLMITFFTLTSSISQPLLGYFLDRYRAKWLGPVGLIWVGAFMGLLGFVGVYPGLLLIAALAGLGPAMFHPHATSIISEITTKNRGRLTSIFLIGGNLGFALGPILVGLLTVAFGMKGMGFLFIPGILMGLFLFRCSPYCGFHLKEKAPPLTLKDLAPASNLLVVATLRSWLYFSILSYIPSYFVHKGNSLLLSNSYLSLMLLAGIGGQILGGTLSDKYGRKNITMISLLAAAPLLYLFLHTSGITAMIFLFLFGFTLMSSFSVTLVMIQEIMSKHVGIASGLMIGFTLGIGGIGVSVTGLIADSLSIGFALNLLVLLPVIAGILTYFIPYVQKK